MQTAMGPRTTVTKDGVPISELQDMKRKAKAAQTTNLLVLHQDSLRQSRFVRNKLSATKITPARSAVRPSYGNVYTPLQEYSIENVAAAANVAMQAPTIEESDPVANRIKKLRMSLGKEMMIAKRAGEDIDSNTKTLHSLLQYSTPRKRVETNVRDALDCGYDTPETKDHLELAFSLL